MALKQNRNSVIRIDKNGRPDSAAFSGRERDTQWNFLYGLTHTDSC